jgi:radical SAM protein with 4Fe4S-binding SPASM domain
MTPGFEPRLQQGSRVLAVMAKPLVRGTVKTRLAAALGDDEALAVYGRLLLGTLAQAELLQGTDLVLAEASADGGGVGRAARPVHDAPPGLAGPPSDPLAGRPARWRRLAQRGDTLGARLAGVFTDLFADGAAFVVAVNSDSPAIPVPYLEQAFAHLAAAPSPGRIILGPAADGGYYLIGLDAATWKAHGDAFTALLTSSPMSAASLLTYTLRAAQARGLQAVQLPLWMDVDEPADLAVLARLDGDAPLRGEPSAGLREIYLHITHRCGRDCRHCYNKDAAWGPGELTTTEWKDAIDQCVALGASSFVFIGGDPLLRDDFVELLDHITGTHQAHARFFFNSYVDEATAAELSRAGRGLLRPLASIDGPRAINDELRGPGSYDDIMASMGNLLAVGLEPVANTVLVRPVLPGLTQLARELRAAGLSRLHLILPHQVGGVASVAAERDAPDLTPSGEDLFAAVKEFLVTAAEVGLVVDNIPSWRRRIGARNDLCAAGCRDLAIDPYGQVHACVITAGDPAFVAGSLREERLETIWRASSSLRLLRAARARDRAECLVCPVVDACGGECWVQAHYAARAHERPAGYTAPFPYCDLVRPMLEELAAEAAAAGDAPSPAGADCVAAGACGGLSAAGAQDYALFDCI